MEERKKSRKIHVRATNSKPHKIGLEVRAQKYILDNFVQDIFAQKEEIRNNVKSGDAQYEITKMTSRFKDTLQIFIIAL